VRPQLFSCFAVPDKMKTARNPFRNSGEQLVNWASTSAVEQGLMKPTKVGSSIILGKAGRFAIFPSKRLKTA